MIFLWQRHIGTWIESKKCYNLCVADIAFSVDSGHVTNLLFHDFIIDLVSFSQNQSIKHWRNQTFGMADNLDGDDGRSQRTSWAIVEIPSCEAAPQCWDFLTNLSSTNLPLWLKNSTMLMNIHYNSCNLCIKQKTFRAVKCETNINCLLLKHFPCIFEEIHFIQPKCEAHNLGIQ